VPGGTVDESFAGRPAWQREVYDAIIGYLRTLGPVHEDAVKVGVFLLRHRKFAEVRPMARALALYLMLPKPVEHPLIARREALGRERFGHAFRLRALGDIDEPLRELLALAYDDAGR
jgi:hypothetical protein